MAGMLESKTTALATPRTNPQPAGALNSADPMESIPTNVKSQRLAATPRLTMRVMVDAALYTENRRKVPARASQGLGRAITRLGTPTSLK